MSKKSLKRRVRHLEGAVNHLLDQQAHCDNVARTAPIAKPGGIDNPDRIVGSGVIEVYTDENGKVVDVDHSSVCGGIDPFDILTQLVARGAQAAQNAHPAAEDVLGAERPKRVQEWLAFAKQVADHIEHYTIPQYGDAPDDQVAGWTAEHCANQISKYATRFGSNARAGQDRLDMLKIAHYACLAVAKMDAEAALVAADAAAVAAESEGA